MNGQRCFCRRLALGFAGEVALVVTHAYCHFAATFRNSSLCTYVFVNRRSRVRFPPLAPVFSFLRKLIFTALQAIRRDCRPVRLGHGTATSTHRIRYPVRCQIEKENIDPGVSSRRISCGCHSMG